VQLHFTTRVRYGFLSVQLNYTIRRLFSSFPLDFIGNSFYILLYIIYQGNEQILDDRYVLFLK
jgi:hypothetical protein